MSILIVSADFESWVTGVTDFIKAEMLSKVLEGPYQPVVLPAQIIKPTYGELRWLVDAAAAAHLRRVP